MKKLIAAILLLGALQVHAQDSGGMIKNTSFGVKAGMNMADMIPTLSHDVDKRFAGYFGAFAVLGFSEKLSFRPELTLSMQGGKQHTTHPDYDYEYISDEKLQYLLMPLMLQYNPVKKLSLQAGPQLGFRMAASYINQIIDDGEVIYESEEDTKKHREFFELGLSAGINYFITKRFFAEVQYNHGITPLNVDKSMVKLRNSVLRAGIGFAIK